VPFIARVDRDVPDYLPLLDPDNVYRAEISSAMLMAFAIFENMPTRFSISTRMEIL